MRRLIVDVLGGVRTRCREVVDTYPLQDLIGLPGVIIGPEVEFLVDPCEETYGAIGHAVADCLGFCLVEEVVSVAFFLEFVVVCETGFLFGGEVLFGFFPAFVEVGMIFLVGFGGHGHIEEVAADVGWVELGYAAGHGRAYVSTLQDVFVVAEFVHQRMIGVGVLS